MENDELALARGTRAKLEHQEHIAQASSGVFSVLDTLPVSGAAKEQFIDGFNRLAEESPPETDFRIIMGTVAIALVGMEGEGIHPTLIQSWLRERGPLEEVVFDSSLHDPQFKPKTKRDRHKIQWIRGALASVEPNDQRIKEMRISQAVRFARNVFDASYWRSSDRILEKKVPTPGEAEHLILNSALQGWMAGLSDHRIDLLGIMDRVDFTRKILIKSAPRIAEVVPPPKVEAIFEEALTASEPVKVIIKPTISLSAAVESRV